MKYTLLSFKATVNMINFIFQIATMNRTTNDTVNYTHNYFCEDITFFLLLDNVPYFVVELLFFTLGFIGNIVTVAVISCRRKLHTPTFTMIACLAVSDACSLLFSLMNRSTSLKYLIWCYGFRSSIPVLYVTYLAFIYFARYNGGMQLCLFVCLRFTAIVYPHKYQAYCTCKAVIVVCVVASTIILISSAVEGALYTVLRYKCTGDIPLLFLNFIVPTSVFISLHCLKLRALRRSPALNSTSSVKMNVVSIFLMSVYVISSASILITYILSCFNVIIGFDNHFNFIIGMSFLFNCAVNPFIYFFSSPPIVQLFRKMWHRLSNICKATYNGNAQEIEMNIARTA